MLHVSIAAEPIFHIGPLAVTNSLLTTWLTMVVLVGLVWLGTRKIRIVPESSGQSIWEMIVEFFYDLNQSMAGDKKAKRFFPLVTSLFLFILLMNWIGLLPGVGTLGIKHFASENHEVASNYKAEESEIATENHLVESSSEARESAVTTAVTESAEGKSKSEYKLTPLFRAGTADLNTTIALAVIAMGAIQYYGFKFLGWKAHLHKYFNFSGPIEFFVGILELISEFAKVISFAFRLFGNIFAGEVLLAVIIFLVPFVVPLPFFGMEIFVGLIQAFVFAMLTLVFLTLATDEHSH